MARIANIDLKKTKNIYIALTYIYGIGLTSSMKILKEAGINFYIKVKDLTDKEVSVINAVIQKSYKIEGELRAAVSQDIKRLIDIGSYRGIRHRKGLPVRGQRTHTNAATRKRHRR